MTWYNPTSWFGSTPEIPFIWVRLDPEHPHCGFDRFSEEKTPPFSPALKVTGMTKAQAFADLMGKVLEWTAIPEKTVKKLLASALVVTCEELKEMLR